VAYRHVARQRPGLWYCGIYLVDPLLGKDLETSNETTAIAMQQHSKHASIALELLLETVFSTWSVQRGYLEDNWGDQFIVVVS
jgi:hypothetical protein